jgi:hypothetical protein
MKEKKRIFREANNHVGFWTMWLTMFTAFLAAGTVVAVVLGLMQLKTISETSRADFILKFKDSFFKKDARDLMENIDENKLKFVVIDSMAFFQLRRKSSDTVISAYEIDENLLNHFDDIGMFERDKILSLSMINEMFGWYIIDCWESAEIQKYIAYEHAKYGQDIFKDFEYIYNKCNKIEKENLNKDIKKR